MLEGTNENICTFSTKSLIHFLLAFYCDSNLLSLEKGEGLGLKWKKEPGYKKYKKVLNSSTQITIYQQLVTNNFPSFEKDTLTKKGEGGQFNQILPFC